MANQDNREYASDQVNPDPSRKISWATENYDEQLETLRARNWVTESMIEQYAKHWHCNRHEALERLMTKSAQA